MSKRFSASVATFVAFLLLGTSGLLAQLVGKGPNSSAGSSSALAATNDVLDQISQIRGLPVKHPVKSGFKSKADIEQMLLDDLKSSNSYAEIEAGRKVLVKMGMIAPDFPLAEFEVKLLVEQIVGFYEPKTKEFYLADWIPISDQRITMAHELTHALQDQYLDLGKLENFPKHESDADLAAHAVVEGEATVVMVSWQRHTDASRLPTFGIPDSAATGSVGGQRFPLFEQAPLVLRENLTFPYFYGAVFVQSVVRARSWDAITKTYDDLPISSEQIMHPQKFINREDPIDVRIPDVSKLLGPSWKPVTNDVMGEFNYRIMLEQFIDKTKAQKAAAGWGGDRYVAFEEAKTGKMMVVQMTTWDTESDAKEFFDAYTDRVNIRYQNSRPFESTDDSKRWRTAEGDVVLSRHGSNVLVIEGGRSALQDQIIPRLWESQYKPISTIPLDKK
jgi:hypothetical protein